MKFERTKNSSRIFFFGMINKICVTLLPFVTRTIIIYKLGRDYLGLTTLFTSVLSMLNMSELGIGSAIAFCMYKPVAEDDKRAVCALMNLMRKLYKLIGFSILGIGLILMPFIKNFINGEYPADTNIYLLYLIYLANSCVSYLLFAYKNTLLEVYQRGDVIQKLSTIVEVCKYGVQIIVLLFFENFYLFAAVLPIAQIITNCWVNIKSKQLYPDITPTGSVPKEMATVIRKKVGYLAAQSITSTFTNSIDNIVISASISLSAVAIYGNYSYITSAVLSFVMIAYSALKSSVGNAIYTEGNERNLELFKSLRFLSWWAATVCSACMICMFQPFIELWVGAENLLPFSAVLMIVIYFYTNCSRQFLTMNYIGTAGLWDKTLLRQILITIVNLILDISLAPKWGVTGIVFASFFTHAIIGLPMDIYVVYRYVLKTPGMKGVLGEAINYVLAGFILGTTLLFTTLIHVSGVAELFAAAVCAVSIPNLIIIAVFHKKKEFVFVVDHIKMLIKKT